MPFTSRRKPRLVFPSLERAVFVSIVAKTRSNIAQDTFKDTSGQEEGPPVSTRHLETLSQVHHLRGRLSAICHGSQQTPAIHRNQRHCILKDPQEMGQDFQVQDKGALPLASGRGPALLQCSRYQRTFGPGDHEPTGAGRLVRWNSGRL